MRLQSILLVEDSPGDASLIRACLTNRFPDTTSHWVETLETALQALSVGSYDCVLLDLGLPDGEGIGIYDQVAACTRAPVVILTGRDDEELALNLIQRGAADYLAKGRMTAEGLARTVGYATERHAAKEELRQREEYFRSILESLGEAVVVSAKDGSVVTANRAAREFFGPDLDTRRLLDIDGSPLRLEQHPVADVLKGGAPVTGKTVGAVGADGMTRWLSVNGATVTTSANDEAAVVCSYADVTEQLRLERERREAEERFKRAVEQSAVGIAITNLDGRIVQANPALADLLGHSTESLIGTTMADLAGLDGDVLRRGPEALGGPETAVHELTMRHRDGSPRWVSVTSTLVRVDGAPDYWFEQLQDSTARRVADLAMEDLALHDALTGLPNRVLLTDRLNQALTRSERDGSLLAVVFLDVDRFKVVNDSLGHSVGDALLVDLAHRLQAAVPDGTVARFGGDEFVVLLEVVDGPDQAATCAQRLIAAADGTRRMDDSALYVTLSAGVALSGPGRGAEELIRNADVAMYRAKAAGGGHVVLFDEADLVAVRQRLELETDLRAAFGRNELVLHYQPIIRTSDEQVLGAEALVRWQHPTHGLVMPNEFIPTVEAIGMTASLTRFVLDEACRQAKQWHLDGVVPEDFRISVNLSANDLTDPDLVRTVEGALATSGIDASRLVLEVTETAMVRETDAALQCLEQVRRLGVRLVVDDFGTGYSSLSYLRRFAVDGVKIDRSFTGGLGRVAVDTAVVRGILSLAAELGLGVVAEGIENAGQFAVLSQLGCPLAQGFLWSKAVSAESFESTLLQIEQDRVERRGVSRDWIHESEDLVQQIGWNIADSIPTSLVVIDNVGTIWATNRTWGTNATEHGGSTEACGVGVNYLTVCDTAVGPGSSEAAVAATGIRSVLSGQKPQFSMEYRCADRVFLLFVAPFAAGSGATMIAHADVTDRVSLERDDVGAWDTDLISMADLGRPDDADALVKSASAPSEHRLFNGLRRLAG